METYYYVSACLRHQIRFQARPALQTYNASPVPIAKLALFDEPKAFIWRIRTLKGFSLNQKDFNLNLKRLQSTIERLQSKPESMRLHSKPEKAST